MQMFGGSHRGEREWAGVGGGGRGWAGGEGRRRPLTRIGRYNAASVIDCQV